MEWLPERPQNGFLSDAAIIALILPGSILSFTLMLGSAAPWYTFLLIIFMDITIGSLILLMALFLNRWLRYRISDESIEVRGIMGWLKYSKQDIEKAALSGVEVNPYLGQKIGLGGFSGMVHGRFTDQKLGWVQVHGFSQVKQAVIFYRHKAIPVILTPEKSEDFLVHLLALDYPVQLAYQ
jgi:Bacterial PH domain